MESERKHFLTKEDLLKVAEGMLFRPGSPRLPRDQMLMMDRVELITTEGGAYGKGRIEAILDIKPNLWFFGCHFKGDPVMPGCLGLDGMWQLMGLFLAWLGFEGKGRALGVKDVKFTGQILPKHQVVKYIIDIKRLIDMKLKMVIADGQLQVDGRTIYTAKDMRVGLFDHAAEF